MNEIDRTLLRRLAWFRPPAQFMGSDLRLPSLPSVELIELLGLSVLRAEPGLSREREMAEVQAYAWIHSAPLPLVAGSVWTGDWRAAMDLGEMTPEQIEAALAEWRCYRQPLVELIEAHDFVVRPRPRREGAKSDGPSPPSNLIHCTLAGHRMAVVMRWLGLSDPAAMWELPWWEAMQIYHADRRRDDLWTVPPAAEREAEEFEGFELAGEDEAENDTPAGA